MTEKGTFVVEGVYIMVKEKYLEIRWIPLFLSYCFLTLHFLNTELLKDKTIASTQLLHFSEKANSVLQVNVHPLWTCSSIGINFIFV